MHFITRKGNISYSFLFRVAMKTNKQKLLNLVAMLLCRDNKLLGREIQKPEGVGGGNNLARPKI